MRRTRSWSYFDEGQCQDKLIKHWLLGKGCLNSQLMLSVYGNNHVLLIYILGFYIFITEYRLNGRRIFALFQLTYSLRTNVSWTVYFQCFLFCCCCCFLISPKREVVCTPVTTNFISSHRVRLHVKVACHDHKTLPNQMKCKEYNKSHKTAGSFFFNVYEINF